MNLLPCKPTGKAGSTTPDMSAKNPSPIEVAQPANASTTTHPVPPVTPIIPPEASLPGLSRKPRRHDKQDATLTTPFELFYGIKPDYRTLLKWGSVGYYRRDSDSGVKRGNFDVQTSVGLALGRSNQTNAMIFWDPGTERMNVSAEYQLDSTARITTHYPTIVYDGHISPLVLRGGGNSDKEPFPPGSKVTILQDDDHLPGTILSVPLSDKSEYTVRLEDPPQQYFVPIEQITREGEPTFHMITTDNKEPGEAPPQSTRLDSRKYPRHRPSRRTSTEGTTTINR
jgi:hypothetical protein